MSKSDEWTDSWEGTVWGERIGGDLPEGHLAYIDTQWSATEERLAHARAYWVERDVGDFEPIGVTGRRFRDIATGIEYVRAEYDVFQQQDPREDPVECFFVFGGQLWFLRPRVAATSSLPLEAATVGGRVVQSRQTGKAMVIDESGRRVATRLATDGKRP